MIEQFSPSSRRLIAVGLAVLVMLLLVTFVIQPIVSFCVQAVSDLRDARYRRDRLEVIVARPLPPEVSPPSPDLMLTPGNPSAVLEAIVAGAAATRSVTLQNASAQVAAGGAVIETLQAQAPELAMMRFINDLERGRPIIRFTRLRLTAAAEPGGPMQLDAAVAAVAAMP